MSPTPPPRFLDRMRYLLGDEFESFQATYARPASTGLRVNLLKTTPETLASLLPWPVKPVPWCPSGFLLPPDCRAGKHPLHAAGLYYLQEPSAMAVAEALDIRPNDWVVDVSAAPGGKSTQIASLLQRTGCLVANDPIPGRIKALGENLERWGAPNAVIANVSVPQLAETLPGRFDRVLVDAPCSGEGMFRRSAAAIAAWSEEHVRGSAARQSLLLADAGKLVRPGGLLLYSTCTFAPEENEAQIDRFLRAHRGWELADLRETAGIYPGRSDWLDDPVADMSRTRRIWPHLTPGDGHFLGLLRAPDDAPEDPPPIPARTGGDEAARDAQHLWDAFRRESLPGFSVEGQVIGSGEHLFLRRLDQPALHQVRLVRPGLPLGRVRGNHFIPAHGLALAVEANAAANRHELHGEETERYLRGETIAAAGPAGWVLMSTSGFPVGWGKRSADVIKNHYPRGLRW